MPPIYDRLIESVFVAVLFLVYASTINWLDRRIKTPLWPFIILSAVAFLVFKFKTGTSTEDPSSVIWTAIQTLFLCFSLSLFESDTFVYRKWKCSQCRRKNARDDRFCEWCGKPRPAENKRRSKSKEMSWHRSSCRLKMRQHIFLRIGL